jgi:hypothetical protein
LGIQHQIQPLGERAEVQLLSSRDFYATAAIAFLWLLIFYVLTPPAHLISGLDPSWEAILVEQFLHHLQFGKHVIFTYGPWGFLSQPRGNPAIYPWLVMGRLILALGLSAGMSWVAVNSFETSRIRRFAWLLLVLALADPPIFVLLVLTFIQIEAGTRADSRRTFCIALLVPACALAAHVKMTSLPLFVLLVVVILVQEIFISKRLPLVSGALVICYFALYIAAGQHFQFFWDYLSGAISMASSHNFGMSMGGPISMVLIGFLLCSLMPICYLLAICSARRWQALPGVLWITAYFLVGFKEAFVRQDVAHLWEGIVNIAIPGALLLIAVLAKYSLFRISWVKITSPGWSFSGLALITVIVAIECTFVGYLAVRSTHLQFKLTSVWTGLKEIPLALAGRDRLAGLYDKDRKALRSEYPLQPLPGTADIFPWDVALLLGNGINYHGRPIPQSYAVLNDHLARINADFFKSTSAPDFVLMDPEPIPEANPRYPSMHDNLAWLSLFTNYQPMGFSGKFLLLGRSKEPAALQNQDVLSQTVSWAQPVPLPLPAEGPIWAQIDVSPRPLGFLAAMLLRPQPVFLNLELGGRTQQYQFLPLIGASGFLLSPLVDDPVSFAALYMGDQGHMLSRPISRMFLTTTSIGSSFYQPRIHIRLTKLTIPRRPTSALLSSDLWRLAATTVSTSTLNRVVPPPEWRVENGHARFQINAPAHGELAISPDVRSLKFEWGVQNRCEDLTDMSSTVELRIALRSDKGDGEQTIWRHSLSARGAERVSENETVKIAISSPAFLTFQTEATNGNCSAGAYLTDLRIE